TSRTMLFFLSLQLDGRQAVQQLDGYGSILCCSGRPGSSFICQSDTKAKMQNKSHASLSLNYCFRVWDRIIPTPSKSRHLSTQKLQRPVRALNLYRPDDEGREANPS